MKVEVKEFGMLDGCQKVQSYTLVNDNGMEITCINYGCTITRIIAPDRQQNFENIVLGFDSLEEYLKHSPYFGCIVGRVAGRIKGASFELDGKEYHLTKNENGNTLHSGPKSFSHVVWNAEIIDNDQEVGVVFSYRSPDGEEGFPGNLDMKAAYTLNNNNELTIAYNGSTDQKTLLNVTNHSYFNLSGNLKRDVLEHTLKLESDQFLELNEQFLPTGQMMDVSDTPFDFRSGRKFREGVQTNDPQIELVGQGYDHPFVLSGEKEILLTDEASGRFLKVETDEVGVVLYTSNSMTSDFSIRGKKAGKYFGVCLETQGLPDAIHHPNFPSIVLDPNENYHTKTKYIFGVL